MKRTGLLLAIMLVIIANLVALSGVWFNRTGAPDSVITLTERELPLMPREDDDSGIAVRLNWRNEDDATPWLDRDKLQELGFACPPHDFEHDIIQVRKLFVVLEYREEESDPPDASRLFAIDAGPSPEELRRSYPDRARYIITSAVVNMRFRSDPADGEKLRGTIRPLLPQLIHVPKTHRAHFTGTEGDLSYRVTLRYGRRHEPWILDVE
jgi:hypothetical protein